MHHQVSARKYRPQYFDKVIGQAHITTTLKNAIRNRKLAHAYLFCGPRGVGKTSCARIVAKVINCENPIDTVNACNECVSCKAFQANHHFNIFELDAASNNSVDDIRHLTEQVKLLPQSGKYKVFIIDEVHMLSASAFNAFLKTLEEPPSYVIFILATTEEQKVLPTVLSRCQTFYFKRIDVKDMVDYLASLCKEEGVEYDEESLQLIARKSEGCMRDALTLMDKIVGFSEGSLTYQRVLEHLNILDVSFFFSLMEYVEAENFAGALTVFKEVYGKGFEGDSVLSGLSTFFRNLLMCTTPQALHLLEVFVRFKTQYMDLASRLGVPYILSVLSMLTQVQMEYDRARDKQLFVEIFLIRLCYLRSALEGKEIEKHKKKILS